MIEKHECYSCITILLQKSYNYVTQKLKKAGNQTIMDGLGVLPYLIKCNPQFAIYLAQMTDIRLLTKKLNRRKIITIRNFYC
jgi:hypothetical protein